MTFGRPEPFFFAYRDQGTTWAVRVEAATPDEAKAEFARMSRSERRRRTVCAMEARERDHTLDLGAWMAGLFRRVGAGAAAR